MKRTVLLSIAAIAIVGLPERALSQEFEGCFFIDGHGQLINLDNLCPRPSNQGTADSSMPARVAPGERSRAANLVEVPIRRRVAGIPVVEVMFNGRRSYEMLLDTGASGTVITAQMAQELNITPAGTATIDTASGAWGPNGYWLCVVHGNQWHCLTQYSRHHRLGGVTTGVAGAGFSQWL